MAEYIDKKEAVKIAEFYGLARGSAISRHSAIADMIAREIDEMPSADVAPVVHGKWEPIINAYGELEGWICKRCGTETKQKSSYCPSCGSRMDGGSE